MGYNDDCDMRNAILIRSILHEFVGIIWDTISVFSVQCAFLTKCYNMIKYVM